MDNIKKSLYRTDRQLAIRHLKGRIFVSIAFIATLIGLITLIVLLYNIFRDGMGWLNWNFINSFPSRLPKEAGVKSALFGTLWMLVLTAAISFPIGVGAAIYLVEYARDNWFNRFIYLNISNLAGIPSIVYGILGLAIFVRLMSIGPNVLAGALTMSLLILPIIIIASIEAIRTVPNSLKEAAYALGSTRWQVVKNIVLPSSFSGILTGTILALSRAIGETAPLIMIGALTFIAFVPKSPLDAFTVLPIQIFNWVSRPQKDFQHLAAAGIIILLVVLLSINAFAIFLRNKMQKRFD
ncbi:MAG: phosphate ABC transporter permease PstA [Actinobacteria bacterium]|nr:phosphate ABC transporter permease PstA [Actinomycetota bacterium]